MGAFERLAEFPRLKLAQWPTPLEALPRLAAALGGPRLWVKRDDVAGPGLGGSKARKLEFIFGEARAREAQVIATFGGLQSNFARQVAAGARQAGLEAHAFYFAPRPARLPGNLLLMQLLGARLHFVPFGGGSSGEMTLEQATRLVRLLVRFSPGCFGRRTYFVPVGGHCEVGALGYAAAAAELEEQLRAAGVEQATIVTAAGTGGTLAGLLAGFHLLRSRHRVLGIDVGRLWRGFPVTIAALASDLCAALGEPHEFAPGDLELIEGTYVGAGYAQESAAGAEALRLAARTEGLVLDPVYSAKAMAGLMDLSRQGRWTREEDLVFLHTGGLPALFT
jgi:1-aminocyclopropane-1-carboxylate deaminase/D-cysteine desulfhydrase-like pyridoxal-dependent ACC family enzyme